jgi:hypothetical protein
MLFPSHICLELYPNRYTYSVLPETRWALVWIIHDTTGVPIVLWMVTKSCSSWKLSGTYEPLEMMGLQWDSYLSFQLVQDFATIHSMTVCLSHISVGIHQIGSGVHSWFYSHFCRP